MRMTAMRPMTLALLAAATLAGSAAPAFADPPWAREGYREGYRDHRRDGWEHDRGRHEGWERERERRFYGERERYGRPGYYAPPPAYYAPPPRAYYAPPPVYAPPGVNLFVPFR